ncbi:MAG: translation elongation factor Ts [Calditrichaeota bacterium]|nr:translation elongation factor Ts [Calditrichota bacterium]MCB0268856.1 translation elongation factor Ts [Calditrichota bacterium]MCB0287631.1 translation elongation factor Ts [Calditrichota bacterium]MCB0298881.1 translation elongation factor Ts [Calditrichota bacterium]MCB9069516.1 translation elongation factor Ts [Calditrichia bacterium]
MANITAAQVKELRELTGAGMMDCKNALAETGGDMEKAVDFLRKKGIAKAEKKAGRDAKDGLVEAYIHPGGKLGVLIEVSCETDFVAKTDDFKELVKNVAMQVAATNPIAITRDQVDQKLIDHEMDIFKAQAKESGKPDHILEKIATGRLEKFYTENVLEEQAFIKDGDKTVKDYVTEVIAKLGENISIRKIARFRIGDE